MPILVNAMANALHEALQNRKGMLEPAEDAGEQRHLGRQQKSPDGEKEDPLENGQEEPQNSQRNENQSQYDPDRSSHASTIGGALRFGKTPPKTTRAFAQAWRALGL